MFSMLIYLTDICILNEDLLNGTLFHVFLFFIFFIFF